MELRLLRTFQTVARLLSFQRSAEVLNYSPSAVSTQIRLLEKEVGVPLFDRLGKSVRLTEAGQMMLQYSQKMLQLENEALAKVAGWAEPQWLHSHTDPPECRHLSSSCRAQGISKDLSKGRLRDRCLRL